MKNNLQKLSFAILLLLSTQLGAQTKSTFEEKSLAPNSYYNGSDFAGGFNSGSAYFTNDYDSSFGGFWYGFSISNVKDTLTQGFMNQYGSITNGGYGSNNYGVMYGDGTIRLKDAAIGKITNGFYITNNTYAYYEMKNGSNFSKKFGGASGNDSDYFYVTINAWKNGGQGADTTLEVYLADFRSKDNSKDYILKTWKWVDLTVFGVVDSFAFNFESSDTGTFGINTPTYFCIDNFNDQSVGLTQLKKLENITIYPNPASTQLSILSNQNFDEINIIGMNGQNYLTTTEKNININELQNGLYIIQLKNEYGISIQKFVKQ